MKLDPVDHALLRHLQDDARRSMRDLAALVGVSTPTASAKVKALESLGIIRAYRAQLDPGMLGRAGHVLVVRAKPSDAPALAARLADEPGVDEVLVLAGGLVHARHFAADATDLQRFLAAVGSLDAVQSYDVHPVLAVNASATGPIAAGDEIAVTCHECQGPIHGAGVRKRWAEENDRDHWFCCRNCAGTYGNRLMATAERAKKPSSRRAGART